MNNPIRLSNCPLIGGLCEHAGTHPANCNDCATYQQECEDDWHSIMQQEAYDQCSFINHAEVEALHREHQERGAELDQASYETDQHLEQ